MTASNGLSPIGPPWSSLTAYDLNEGTIKWKIALGNVPELAAKGVKNAGSHYPKVGPGKWSPPVPPRSSPGDRATAHHPRLRCGDRRGALGQGSGCGARRHSRGLRDCWTRVHRVLRLRPGGPHRRPRRAKKYLRALTSPSRCLRSSFSPTQESLFESQRHHRVDVRSLARRQVARDGSH